ncbi:MAG: hypothetical protein IJ565_01390 [Bacilli bacterium]|nr:hypothetical protein [Bacilli bacterium]
MSIDEEKELEEKKDREYRALESDLKNIKTKIINSNNRLTSIKNDIEDGLLLNDNIAEEELINNLIERGSNLVTGIESIIRQVSSNI